MGMNDVHQFIVHCLIAYYFFQLIRENVLVALSNCAGYMDLSPHPEHIVLPLLAGLLEWAVSPSAVAQDPFPAVGMHSNISPQRLALETLCKLCVMVRFWDVYYTSPQSFIITLFVILIRWFIKSSVHTFQPLIVIYRWGNFV